MTAMTYVYLLTCIYFALIVNVCGVPVENSVLEKLNELDEIHKAVVESVKEWELRKRHRTKREEPSVCYPDLGCFQASGPFGYLDMLPSTPEHIDTKFLLYPSHSKRRSGSSPSEVPFNNVSDAFAWAHQGFNNTLNTKVLVHGFGSDCSHIWVYEMRSALMAVEDLNVICVDWGKGAALPNYVRASANTRLVGKQLAILLKGLVDQNGLSFRNMHLIGFSLGAHVAGFAGAELGNLSRITGLDPAGPLFESQDPRARLDQTDAGFVDVIHSNGENLILGGLGSWQPMGHVDFYPNGGRMQKGCSNIFVGAVSDIIWSSAVEGRSLCNHRRAYKFFTDSVSPRCHFPAFPCDSYEDFLAGKCFPCTEERKCGNMGYYADRSKGRGQLYLITRDEEPFCAHQYNIRIESAASEVPIVSYGKFQVTLIGDSLLNETFTLTRKEDEEMHLGTSFSRIIVPHPILLEPQKIQVLYTAYSGWLTSGLLQWRIDKITLRDSFGRSVSVCKKDLILDSGVPVILPLYPGECHLPSDNTNTSDSVPTIVVVDEKNKNLSSGSTNDRKFVPTTSGLVRAGIESFERKESNNEGLTFRDAFEMFNIPWTNTDNNNFLDIDGGQNGQTEESRAFHTRGTMQDNKEIQNGTQETKVKVFDTLNSNKDKEVMEPILKPQIKAGRAKDFNKSSQHEITEPILASTAKPKRSEINESRKYKDNQAGGSQVSDEWIPALPTHRTGALFKERSTENNNNNNNNKWKRQDESKVYKYNGEQEELNTFNAIVKTVQFIPQRLAKMFEEAEKYARETILPFVSIYTPKFLSDFITPKDQPKYLPLVFEETTEKSALTTAKLYKQDKSVDKLEIKTKNFNPPPTEGSIKTSSRTSSLATSPSVTSSNTKTTTISTTSTTQKTMSKVSLSERIDETLENDESSGRSITDKPNGVYINLPVIDDKHKEIKYIPLTQQSLTTSTTSEASKSDKRKL